MALSRVQFHSEEGAALSGFSDFKERKFTDREVAADGDGTMTDAYKAKKLFEDSTKTVSIVEIGRRLQAARYNKRDENTGLVYSHYVFPDGSVLNVSGRGNNHRVWL